MKKQSTEKTTPIKQADEETKQTEQAWHVACLQLYKTRLGNKVGKVMKA